MRSLSFALALVAVCGCTCDDPKVPAPPSIAHRLSLEDGGIRIDPTPETLSATESTAAQYMCSKCLKLVTREHLHVIPFWNESLAEYVTTFRCDECWLSSLEETRQHARAHAGDPEDRKMLAVFAERHQVGELHREDPARYDRARDAFFERLRTRELVLSP